MRQLGTIFENSTAGTWPDVVDDEGQDVPGIQLQQLPRYVMADEARHVAFGVLSLKELDGELSATEIRERQEFAFVPESRT